MKDALIVTALSVVPKNLVARLMGHGTRLRLPSFLHKALVGWFVRKYGVNLDECEGGIEDYPSLAQFFVRPLKAGVRPVEADPDILVSPVDAVVHTFGAIHKGNFLQYDGKPSSVPALSLPVAQGLPPGAQPRSGAHHHDPLPAGHVVAGLSGGHPQDRQPLRPQRAPRL